MTHYEPSHLLDPRCFQKPIIIAYGSEWVKTDQHGANRRLNRSQGSFLSVILSSLGKRFLLPYGNTAMQNVFYAMTFPLHKNEGNAERLVIL